MTHRIADALLGHDEIATPKDGARHKEPTHGVGAVGAEDLVDIGIVLQTLGHLHTVGPKHDPVSHTVTERRAIEQRGGEYMQGVKPAARLTDVFDDEVSGVVVFEPVLIFERIVHLGVGHRARLEPAVEYLGHASHHRRTAWIVGVGANEFVDGRPMQIVGSHAEVSLDVIERAVDVKAWIHRVVGFPDRDG